MENFGSFRQPATVDFADVDYFALVGPTGAGKSTVIDAICFALYGTVPRWGKENVVSLALAPSATSGKVALVFETGGRRYAAVRVLARNARGVVGTKEARLDELDRAVPPDADLIELLEATVRPIAEGETVTAEVQGLTGLEYRYFTQCVVLPQGQFAEFLHAQPRERQDLLVQLLDAGVYERIRQRAVREEDTAKQAAAFARDQLAKLTDADEAAEQAASTRLATLDSLATHVRSAIETLRGHDEAVRQAAGERDSAQRQLAALTTLAMPDEVPTLTETVRAAAEKAARLAEEADRRDQEERQTDDELTQLGDNTPLTQALAAHHSHEQLAADLAKAEADTRAAAAQTEHLAKDVDNARTELAQAEIRRDQARDTHAAIDLATRLTLGEACPVCLRPVAELPHHPTPADLDQAEHDLTDRRSALDRARHLRQQAEIKAAQLQQKCTEINDQLAGLRAQIDAHPDRGELEHQIAAIEAAEQRARQARRAARAARKSREEADRQVHELRDKTVQAWRDLDAARDAVVSLGAPPIDRDDDLHRAWTTLLGWREHAAGRQCAAITTLAERLTAAEQARDGARAALITRLERDSVTIDADATPDTISETVTAATAHAEAHLRQVRHNRTRVRELDEQARAHEQHTRVAHELTLLLRANNFEKWLCAEALELLVTAASETLRDLSDGQYELALSAKSDIEVIDYAEAAMRRSVRTLSGGETFQAALALALALSDQVAGLAAAAARSLDSIFLDEGFGTLDPATLDTVATTLERLAVGGDRMVGIVTHVPALADRVPVRFDVIRDGSGSHIKKATT
jgi:exonuclease SbcC